MIRLLLLVAALLLPSRIGTFDGIPLDGGLELALLLLLVPFACSRELRQRVDDVLGPRGRPVATGALAGAVALKVLLLVAAPNGGFDSCYRVPDRFLAGDCEVTFFDPFRLSGGTRVDERFEFGPRAENPAVAGLLGRILLRDGQLPASNWNLSFVNDWRYNWIALAGLPDRNRLPFEFRSHGPVELEEPGTIAVEYVGSGRLRVGRETVALSPSYTRPARATLEVGAGRQELELEYAFRRRATNDDPPEPHYAELVVRGPDGEPLESAGPGAGWQVAVALVTAALLAAGAGLALLCLWLLRSYWWVAAAVAPLLALGAAADSPRDIVVTVQASAPFVAAVMVLLAALLWRPGPHPMLAGWIGAATAATVRTLDEFPDFDSVLYPNGGDDPILYESMAASILISGSLEGQEPVFGFQPGFRYLLFGLRMLVGPAGAPLSVLALAGLVAGVIFLADRLRTAPEAHLAARLGAIAAGALMLGVLWSDTQIGHVRALNSEWTTWILFPLGAGLLLGGRTPRAQLGGALLLGVEAVVRMNQLPLIVAVLGLYVLQAPAGRRRVALATCAAGLALLLLPLAHNVYYGGEWRLLSSSAGSVNEPGEIISDADAHRRTRVADQLTRAFYLPPAEVEPGRPDQRAGDLRLYVGGLELLWLAAIGTAVHLRRRLSVLALAGLALPLAALLPYAFYDPISYYPRHVVIGWLAMGLSVLLVARALPARERRGAA